MSATGVHTASGPMAGYLFQLERALYWLSTNPRNSVLGIETEDDLVVKLRERGIEETILEQDKHVTSGKKPFSDKSEDLWKTIYIWLKAINEKAIDIDNAQFYMVTNKELGSGIAREIDQAKNKKEIDDCLTRLQNVAKNPSATIRKYTKYIINIKFGNNLKKLIKNVSVIDKTLDSAGEQLRERIIDELNIPPRLPSTEIIDSLQGWLHRTVMGLWRDKKPAFIYKEFFLNQYQRLLEIHRKISFAEKAKSLVSKSISEKDRASQKDRLFVSQISLIFSERESEIIMEAIDDFLCSSIERVRLAEEGDITHDDLASFDNRLFERWKAIFRRNARILNHKSSQEIGINNYEDTLDHRELLAGRQTEEYYLTKGSYHRLADIPVVGWHPDFNNILSKKKKR